MLENINEAIIHEMLEEENKKIKESESLEDYLKSFDNRNLTLMSVFKVYANQDILDIDKIYNLNHKSKKYIIDYIKPNIKEIWESFLKIVPIEMVELVHKVMKSDGLVEYTFDDFDLGFLTIAILKNYALAKVEYNKKEETIKVFMPKEFCNAIKVSLDNKSIIQENKRNNEIFEYVIGLLEAYGMIEMDSLYQFVKEEYKISIEDFDRILECKSMIDEVINIHMNDRTGHKLVCNIEFADIEEAFVFYEETKGEYKKFTKKEVKQLQDDSYIEGLNSYKKLIEYLQENFEGFFESEDIVNIMLILDYINVAQLDEEEAKNAFMHNVEEFFEVSEKDKKEMLKLVQDIFKEYPKWKKRGNV